VVASEGETGPDCVGDVAEVGWELMLDNVERILLCSDVDLVLNGGRRMTEFSELVNEEGRPLADCHAAVSH